MTVGEYIRGELRAFMVTDGEVADMAIASGLDEGAEYDAASSLGARRAICLLMPRLMTRPRMENISEGGFSATWRFDDLAKHYLLLCKEVGLEADRDVVSMSGLSVITDKTSEW